MFGIGTSEFLVIMLVAVLVLGPEHLPRIMRVFTKVMSDFRRVSTDFQRTINLEASQEEWRKQQAEAAKKKKKKKPAPAASHEEENAGLAASEAARPETPAPDAPETAAAPVPEPGTPDVLAAANANASDTAAEKRPPVMAEHAATGTANFGSDRAEPAAGLALPPQGERV